MWLRMIFFYGLLLIIDGINVFREVENMFFKLFFLNIIVFYLVCIESWFIR